MINSPGSSSSAQGPDTPVNWVPISHEAYTLGASSVIIFSPVHPLQHDHVIYV